MAARVTQIKKRAQDNLDLSKKLIQPEKSWIRDQEDLLLLSSMVEEFKKYIIELEDMLGCAAPKSYCDSCSCGKKEALGGQSGSADS